MEQELFNLDRPLSALEMERALNLPSRKALQSIPWQYCAIDELEEGDRWLLMTKETKLWPYRRLADVEMDTSTTYTPDKPVVMYPDIFADGFGYGSEEESFHEVMSGNKSLRWESLWTDIASRSKILSVLALARAMGALVTSHLHSGVTHVLCLLKVTGSKEISFPLDTNGKKAADIFYDEVRGELLVERLKTVIPKNKTVRLVSPSWLVERWDA